jgi:hypothetical protein
MSTARGRVIGSTIRNTAEMLRMVTEEPRTSLAVKVLAVRVELVIVPVPELVIDPAVLPVLAIGRALVELEHDPVAAEPELGIVPVAAELELGIVPVAAEPELGIVPVVALVLVINQVAAPGPETALVVAPELELVQVAVALRTKSVTTRPRRGRVAAPRVEDSAVVAETTREPVATEAVKAWAAAE